MLTFYNFLLCYNFKIIEKLQEIAQGTHIYPYSRFTDGLYFVLFGLSFFLCLSLYVRISTYAYVEREKEIRIYIYISSLYRETNNFISLSLSLFFPKLFERKLGTLCLFMPKYFIEQWHILYNHSIVVRYRSVNINIKPFSNILSIFQFLIVPKVCFTVFSLIVHNSCVQYSSRPCIDSI